MRIVRGGAPCNSLWTMLWGTIGISASESSELWARLHQSKDPQVRAWRYSLDRFMALFTSGQANEMTPSQFLSGPWSGKIVIDALERLCIDQLLDRKTASRLEEIFLRQLTSSGGWRFRKVHAHENQQKSDGFQIQTDPA